MPAEISPACFATASSRPHLRAKMAQIFFVISVCLVLLAPPTNAQESSSISSRRFHSIAGPAGALSRALSAACSQSQIDFANFLTARNKQSFARMTPAARISLMKRFVLLSQPGKPTTTLNPSGRPTVLCETPDGAAEIQSAAPICKTISLFFPSISATLPTSPAAT